MRDFEKICQERDVERGLAAWEQLIEDAKLRKTQHAESTRHGFSTEAGTSTSVAGHKPMHLLSAQELYAAHLTPTLVRAEKELQGKLESVQRGNKDMMSKIEEQRGEMQSLVEHLEKMVEDVEAAAQTVENDPLKDDLRRGVRGLDATGEDVNMGGST